MERKIETSVEVSAPLAVICDVLRQDPGVLFPEGSGDHRARRFTTMIAAPVGASAAVEHEVRVELGVLTVTADGAEVPMRWEPVGNGLLLPSFDGVLMFRALEGRRTEIQLRGGYRVPLGPVGRFGDTVVGPRVARGTIAALVDGVAHRLGVQANRRAAEERVRPAPAPPDLREPASSDLYLG